MSELTRLLVERVSQKDNDDAEGNEGRPPAEQEHDDQTTHRDQQRQPLTVEPEGWTPTCTHTHVVTQCYFCPYISAAIPLYLFVIVAFNK